MKKGDLLFKIDSRPFEAALTQAQGQLAQAQAQSGDIVAAENYSFWSDPGVSFTSKSNLVEGGIGGTEAHIADHKLQKAAKNGDLPLSFNITNIAPAAGGSVTADVAVSGPKLPKA